MESWKKNLIKAAEKLPIETRQRALDLIRARATVGETAQECGITTDEVTGVIFMNTVVAKTLRDETL